MTAPRVDRRLAAILAADVVGYSRLVERDEAGTLQRFKMHRKELVEPLVAEHGGRIVKLMGDGILCEFPSVVDAVQCAVVIQKAMAEREADVPEEQKIRLRIGINLGDVVHEEGDLYGDGVNIAARLEQLAEPGGIAISGTAHDQLQGKLGCGFDFLGEQRVKNIERPVRVYRVLLDGVRAVLPPSPRVRRPRWMVPAAAAVLLVTVLAAGAAWWFWPTTLAGTGKPSIAVLPFADLSSDDAARRLANGVTEDIITDLSRFNEFDVMARNTTATYAGTAVDIRKVGAELGVGYVLEGSVQRDGDRVRVTAQLIDAATSAHLWSERWDRAAADVFAVQTEIAEQVAGKLGGFGVIERAEQKRTRQARPGNLSAYELVRRGQEVSDGHTPAASEDAIRLFKEAVAIDPSYAHAWTQLAAALDHSTSFGAAWEPAEKAALEAAQRAIALDPRNAEAHSVLGHVLGNLDEFTRAQAEFDTALDLNPGSAVILTKYAGWASTFGQPERGAEAADRAIRLDPNYPIWAVNFYRWAYFMAGRFEDAWRVQERQPMDQLSDTGYVMRAAILGALGRADEARRAVADAVAHDSKASIQGFVSQPGMTDDERRKLVDALRKADFPPCASKDQLAELKHPFPLEECAA